MALKLGYGGKLTSISNTQQSSNSNELPSAARIPIGLATSALGTPSSILQGLASIPNYAARKLAHGAQSLGIPAQEPEPIQIPLTASHQRDLLSRASGYERGSFEPQGLTEQAGNFVAGETIPFLASGGLSAPLRTAGTIAGAHLGSSLGQTAAEQGGLGEEGQFVASLLGGVGGGLTAGKIGKNRPSRELFQKDKAMRVKKYEDTVENLDKSRTANYAKAEKAAKNVREDASDIQDLVRDIEQKTLHGVDSADKVKIREKLNDLDTLTHDGKLSLEAAINFKKNVNSAIYDRNINDTLKKYYGDINRGVNQFIKRVGEIHPEHGKAFQLAEQQTAELGALRRQDIDALKNEKYKDFVHRIFNEEEGAIIQAVKDTGPSLSLSDYTLGAIGTASSWLGGLKTGGLVTAGLGGIRGISNELRTVRKILKSNPALQKEFKQATQAALKKDYPVFISRIQKFDQDLNAKIEEQSPKIQGKLKLGY